MEHDLDPLPQSIALIGMGCRFPGGIDSPDDLWKFLQSSGDAITDVPADRWPLDSFFDPEPGKKGKIYTRRGGFLDDVRGFDPEFFSLSPHKANSMDPQQRLLLETTWKTEASSQSGCVGVRQAFLSACSCTTTKISTASRANIRSSGHTQRPALLRLLPPTGFPIASTCTVQAW